MANEKDEPTFYKDYSATEIKKFEAILKLIHGANPNTELAKKMVLEFSGEEELGRFRNFKSEFENTLKVGSNKLKSNSSSQEQLNQRRTDLVHQKTHLLNQGIKRTGASLDTHRVKDHTSNKKPKH